MWLEKSRADRPKRWVFGRRKRGTEKVVKSGGALGRVVVGTASGLFIRSVLLIR